GRVVGLRGDEGEVGGGEYRSRGEILLGKIGEAANSRNKRRKGQCHSANGKQSTQGLTTKGDLRRSGRTFGNSRTPATNTTLQSERPTSCLEKSSSSERGWES